MSTATSKERLSDVGLKVRLRASAGESIADGLHRQPAKRNQAGAQA